MPPDISAMPLLPPMSIIDTLFSADCCRR